MSEVGEVENNQNESVEEASEGKLENNKNVKGCNKHAKVFRCCPPDFCDMIGRREARITELTKHEQDLRRRLEMQEWLVPVATLMSMKSGDGLPDAITGVIDEQAAQLAMSCPCPNATLSQHHDIRIREIESTRRNSLRRLEEARGCLIEKKTAVDERLRKIDEAKRKKDNLENKIRELEQKIGEGKTPDGVESLQSVQSLGPSDLDYLMKLEELVKSELATKKQLDELERRQEANMKALEIAAQVMAQEKNHEELDGLKGKLEVKSSANQQLADRICELEDQTENLKSKLSNCNQKLLLYTKNEKVDSSVGENIIFEDKESMAHPEIVEVETSPEILETKDQDVEAVVSVESFGVLAQVDVTEKSVQETLIDTKESYVEAVVSTNSLGTMTEVKSLAESIEVMRDESPQFVDLPESSPPPTMISNSFNLGDDSQPKVIDAETVTDDDTICLERQELKIWLETIGEIRGRISQCREYNVVQPAVNHLGSAISRHLGIEFVELPDESGVPLTSGSNVQTREQPDENIQDDLQNLSDNVDIEEASSSRVWTPTQSMNAPIGTSTPMTTTKKVWTPKQSFGLPVGTSTPLVEHPPTVPEGAVRRNIEIIVEEESENATILSQHSRESGNSSAQTDSSVGKDMGGTRERGKMTEENFQDSQEPTADYDATRNSSEATNAAGNTEDASHPEGTQKIDEEMVPILEVEGREIRYDEDGINEMLDGDRSNVLSRDLVRDKSSARRENVTTGSRQNIPGPIIADAISFVGGNIIDESDDHESCKSPLIPKLSRCLCHSSRDWPKMTRREYESFREEAKKSPSMKHHISQKRSRPKTVATSISTAVETQTNIQRHRYKPKPNFNCNPCDCDPCGSECSSTSDFGIPERRNQGVIAKITRSKR